MPPATYGVASLPVELLHAICEDAERSGLYSIALCDKTFNSIATPILYSTIDVQFLYGIYACVRTLAAPPSKTSMNRDLASYVEVISLYDPNERVENGSKKTRPRQLIRDRLDIAVPRMRRLRSFTCRVEFDQTNQTFTTLVNGTLPLIDSVDISVEPWELEDTEGAPLSVAVPSFKKLKLRWTDWAPRLPTWYKVLICSVLSASRYTLQSLSLGRHAFTAFQAAWRSIPSFPALRELEAEVQLLSEPAFQDTTSIRQYAVLDMIYTQLTPTVLPNLEEVTCAPYELKWFLPERAEHQRPIKVITLDRARYERTLDGGSYTIWDMADEWHDTISRSLRALEFSGARLVRLSVVVSRLRVRDLLDLSPLLNELEYLLMMLEYAPGEGYEGGDTIFAMTEVLDRMPRLHTFLISDGMPKTCLGGSPFYFAHDEAYQRRALANYDEYSSSLRRVAFTSEFEWEKRQDGWHPWGHVVADREILSDGEDEDLEQDR
ncbi:hypothetical protein L226DRAFT_615629 [Lentinus tigrinus ALCF2SS1-7]|uniref:F-box domain-containing protein n=1 Tax=Lentinus tigrinus ALCF2SS1-6 TaxID=1328759 RepID=A0A5C2RUN2_9APHY|nr:hypothetical protein L227DRAFT_657016 [Lentinus tigrinus ALCF2SS1-6]RPD71357.1 hypothetical protein L226DRAFT_615629 [Lentinus tigrinus ALCF2SS1-7]